MAAEYNLGTAHGQVVIDSDTKGIGQTEQALGGLEKSGARAHTTLNNLAKGMAVAGTAIAVGIGVAVKSAISFEKELSGIKAVTGATTDQMEQVRAKALQLGKDTKFSAGEAAQAMSELAKAGISLPDIMNGAADATVALAAAGEIDLPKAAEIAAAAMNIFSLKAQDLPRVADLIAGAANASAISVDDFRMAMQQSGAVAALAGLDIQDLAVAIAEMGNAGLKGSDAGTSLKTFLQNLQPTTKKATTLMKDLGIITAEGANRFYDASGNLKSFGEVAQILQDALKGMTAEQKSATLQTLFGSDAIRAAAIISQNGAKGFNDLATAMGKVKAADVAKTRMDNLSGSIEQLKGSLETTGIVLGTILIPFIRQAVDAIGGLLNGFLELSPAAQAGALNIAGAASAFLLVGAGALKLITTLSALRTALATVWATALGPIALVIAAILAVGAAVFILYQHFQPVRDVVDAVGRALKSAFQAVLPTINTVVLGVQNFLRVLQGTAAGGQGFVGFMGTLGAIVRDVVLPALIAVGRFLLETFGPIFSQVLTTVMGFVTGLLGYFRSIQPQLTAILNAVVAAVRFAFNLLAPIIVPVMTFILNFVKSTLQLLALGIGILLNGIANIFRGVFNIIGGIVKVFLSVLTGNWRGAWEGVKQIVTGALQLILGVIQTIIGGAIVAICISSLKVIGNAFRAGFAAIRGVVTGAMSVIRAVISGGMAAARGVVSGALAAIRAVFTGNLGALGGIARSAINAVVGAFRAGIATARSVVSGGLSGIVEAVAALGSRMFNAGAQIMKQLASGITSRIGDAVSAVKGAVSKVAGLIPGSPVKEGPLRSLNNGHAGKMIASMLTSGIRAGTPATVRQAARLVDGVDSAFARLATTRALALNASVGTATTSAGAVARSAYVGSSGVASGTGTGYTFAPNVAVYNPPPVSGERQVLDALGKVEALHNPLGVSVG